MAISMEFRMISEIESDACAWSEVAKMEMEMEVRRESLGDSSVATRA